MPLSFLKSRVTGQNLAKFFNYVATSSQMKLFKSKVQYYNCSVSILYRNLGKHIFSHHFRHTRSHAASAKNNWVKFNLLILSRDRL